MTLSASVLALGVSITGASTSLAATMAPDGSNDLASYVQGGGSAAAVAGLVYVARLIVRGELVPRPVKDAEAELNAGIMAAAQREAAVLKVAEDATRLNGRLEAKHDESLLLLADVRRSLDVVGNEMQYWREMRDRGTRREDRGPQHRPGAGL